MSEFDERLTDVEGQAIDDAKTNPTFESELEATTVAAPELEATTVAVPETEPTTVATPEPEPVTLSEQEVDPAEVDEILAEITGANVGDAAANADSAVVEDAPASDLGADAPAEPADASVPIEKTIPDIEVLSASDVATAADVPQQPVVEAAQASLLETPEEKPKKRPSKRALTIALVVLVALLGVYLAGVVAFMRVFMPNTTINGEDVSFKSVEEVAKANSDSIDSFELAVTGDGMNLQIKATDINAAFDGERYARTAMSQQHPWTWPLTITSTHAYAIESNLSYDAARLDDMVGTAIDAVNANAIESTDAKFNFNRETLRYEVVPEVQGTKIDKPSALELVRQAISNREKALVLGPEVLTKPTVLSDNAQLVEAVNKVNASLGAIQDIDYNAQTMHTLGAEDTYRWINLEPDLTVSFDTAACTDWCRGPLSQRIDSVGTARTFTTPDGREISVSGGTYGWSLDGGELAQIIAENVLAGKSAHIEAPWMSTAAAWAPGGNEWGDTYVEIDLGAQHVRYFSGGQTVWESDCVSGGLNDGKMHYTPTGVYYINSNMESGNVELKGEIDPVTKQPEYISYVKYWMPFIDNSHALHDADWRSSFGGDIYLYSGSHGCVNLPVSKAAELYDMVSVGTVVVVHD